MSDEIDELVDWQLSQRPEPPKPPIPPPVPRTPEPLGLIRLLADICRYGSIV